MLAAAASEVQNYGLAIFVVNNNEMVKPELDEQNKIVSWTKVAYQQITSQPGSESTFFEFNVEETDLEMLIGETVHP